MAHATPATPGRSRRRWRTRLARGCQRAVALVLLATPLAWGTVGPAGSATAPVLATVAVASPRIAFTTHAVAGEPWWEAVQRGAQEAAQDFKVQVDYLPAADTDPLALARVLDGLDVGRYDALVHTIPDLPSLQGALQRLRAKKALPSVTVNLGSTVHSEELGALGHIGQPDYATAEIAGQRARKNGVKSFLCINHYGRTAASHARCKGFAVGLGVADSEAHTLMVDGSVAEMKQQILRFVEATPGIQAWVALGAPSAEAALEASRALAKGGTRPWMAAFDMTPAVADGVRVGDFRFAIDQQPYLQGYLPVALLAQQLRQPERSWLHTQLSVFSDQRVHERMARYGLELRPSDRRHLVAGPGFVTLSNLDRIERLNLRGR